ncbi:MAG TPA: PQQ-binding-like beta-propeller repeat protein [Gemmatimonadales bacterium]|nr:PQQ-binding-like beta-propeller repeat protein [Gemmatimonadales bacterium]
MTSVGSLRLLCVGLLTLVALAESVQAQEQSPAAMFRGGPTHAGVYSTKAGRTLAGLEWRFATGGSVISSPAIAHGVVYVGSGDGWLYALRQADGNKLWAYQADAAIASSPAVAEGSVYFTSRSGRIYAVDAKSGQLRWFRATEAPLPLPWGHESGDHFISSPVLAGKLVIVGAGDGGVYAVATATGRVIWRGRTGGRVRSSPAVWKDRVFVGSADGVLYCFDLASGQSIWQFRTEGAALSSAEFGFDRRTIQSSPAVSDGTVFVGARDGFLYAVSADSGHQLWRFDHQQSWVITSPAVQDSTVYAASSDAGFVQALDARSGRERWHNATGYPVWSSPAVTGSALLVGDRTGRLMALSPGDGAPLWHFQTGGTVYSSPAVSGTMAVFGSTDGSVYALRLGDSIPVRRAVFFDSTYLKSASFDARAVARYLTDAGYQLLDAGALARWLTERIADQAPSTLVFAIDYLPETVAQAPLDQSLLRRYLDGGGKVVWPGSPPLLWPINPATGSRGGYDTMQWDAPCRLLGVAHQAASFDLRGARATALGAHWGLNGYWRDSWGVPWKSVTAVLAKDEWGLATSWIRQYGGAPGTGFIRVPGNDPASIYLVAEIRPSEPLVR